MVICYGTGSSGAGHHNFDIRNCIILGRQTSKFGDLQIAKCDTDSMYSYHHACVSSHLMRIVNGLWIKPMMMLQ